MQINTVCNIFCIKNLKKSSNHEQLIEQYHECIKPIINAQTHSSELKKLTRIYGRLLIQLSNNLQKELSTETKQISQNAVKIRHTLLQVAFLTDQCLVKLKSALKMKQWSIEKMWNSFLCRAVSYRFWDLISLECDIFLNYLNCLPCESFSNTDFSEYIALLTSNIYNKSRALIEINFDKNYNQSIKLLQKSIKLCCKHMDLQWKISYLDRTFRVMNKIITDFCQHNHNNTEEFALRSQALYCLLIKNKLTLEKYENRENINIKNMKKIQESDITFWDITHQYIRFVKNRYNETDLIRFRKIIIEIYIPYNSQPIGNKYDINFINLCIDYVMSIGQSSAKLKIELLNKITQQCVKYIENLHAKIQFEMIFNLVISVAISQIAIKHNFEYIKNATESWDKTLKLLKENTNLFIEHHNIDFWRLLSKSIRNIPYFARYIEDEYSFKSGKRYHSLNARVINLCKVVVLSVEQLFNIWTCCNVQQIGLQSEKLKNANHRLFDTLITILAIEQLYFLFQMQDKNELSVVNEYILNICDILELLKLTKRFLCGTICDPDLFKSLATKGYNIAVQIYNTHNYYEYVLNITEIIRNLCSQFKDEELRIKCDKLYESALFKCDDLQIVYDKIAKNIAVCLEMANNLKTDDISMAYKYLKLLVKYETHSMNQHKFAANNTSISLIDMLTNLGIELSNLNENIIIKLLTQQLELYQSSFSYNTTIQQIEILEILLKNYFNNEKPLQRAIALLDLAKLIRISKAAKITKTSTPKKHKTNCSSEDMSQIFASQLNISFMSEETETTRETYDICMDEYDIEMDRNPLNLLEEAIDLLTEVKQSGADDNEADFEIILDDVLACAYLWRSIVKRELYATEQAVQSQIDSLNSSIINLRLDCELGSNDNDDRFGFESMLKALDIWSNLISKCDKKCKHFGTEFDKCDKCHKCFRSLFCTIQHLQIMVDYMHLNNYISLEIFVLDRMISLLSTMCTVGKLSWCREYRLLCLCWSAMAYYKFGNINESNKVFMELEPILLANTPNISQHVANHIKIIYAKYQALTNEKDGIKTLILLKKEFEKNKNNKWENVYLIAKVKIALAQVQIESPQIFININNEIYDMDIDPQTLAKDSLLRFTSLIEKLNQQFTFKNEIESNKHVSLTYNSFINALPHKKFEFFAASSKQYLSTHHPQSPLHENHMKMFYHYPSEFRLISDFLKCIQILGRYLSIIHEPKHSLYHFENGQKATHNLVVPQQQQIFLIDLAKIQSKQRNYEQYDSYLKRFNEISILSSIKLSSCSLKRRIHGSLCKITPYAHDYDASIMNILSIECIADELRYKSKYVDATTQYEKCLSIIESFFDAKKVQKVTKIHFVPIIRLQCSIQRKYALCLLHLRQTNSLRQCLKICFEILSQKSILNDLMIAKIKLYIGQCLILQLQSGCHKIMQIIWKGNAETIELESILHSKMNIKSITENVNINDEIATIICCRQNLIQCLLILLHLKTVNPTLIKKVSFALSYIYGETNIKWSTMFLNICQSANTRQAAIKQYSKQLNIIKQQWHQFKSAQKRYNINIKEEENNMNVNVSIKDLEISIKKLKLNKKNNNNNIFNKNDYLRNEEYNSLYTRFYHKLVSVSYFNENENDFDYQDYKCCYKMMDKICDKFYCQTVEYLQYSWNCLSIEVDHLLQTMLICVINPSSTSRNTPTEIVIVNMPINNGNIINNEINEIKDEENDDNTYDNIMNEFNAFLHEANESTHCGKKCITKDEIKCWWQNRYKLDEKLKNHLDKIQFDILGIFRCLFIPHFRHKQSKKLMQSSCQALVTAINEYLLKKTNEKYLSTCFILKNNKNNTIRSCKMIFFEKLLQLMLITECQDDEVITGLSYIFCISDNYLLNKLLDTVKQHIQTINNKFISKLNISDFDPLIMSIGDTLSHLPWENIPILLFCLPSICRIPCLEFAALRVLEYKNYNKDKNNKNNKYYFIINPKGDLKKTQQRFDRLLNEEWNGIRGIEPTFDEFRYGLEESNVFLYVGHNGGEEFVNCHKLQTFSIKSITFLMGCSSGLLKKKGIFESNGIANYYMIASCPIVIANLWDVTDKDIDQFSCQMLRKSILKQSDKLIDIAKAVNISRSVCKLKYLNGAAPICYGIPFHLINGIYV